MDAGQAIMMSVAVPAQPVQNMPLGGSNTSGASVVGNGFGSMLGEVVMQQTAAVTPTETVISTSTPIILSDLQASLTTLPELEVLGDQEMSQNVGDPAQLLAGFIQAAMIAPSAMQTVATAQSVGGTAAESTEVTQVTSLPSAMVTTPTAALPAPELIVGNGDSAAITKQPSVTDNQVQNSKQQLVAGQTSQVTVSPESVLVKTGSVENVQTPLTDNPSQLSQVLLKTSETAGNTVGLKAVPEAFPNTNQNAKSESNQSFDQQAAAKPVTQVVYADPAGQSVTKSAEQDLEQSKSNVVLQNTAMPKQVVAFQATVVSPDLTLQATDQTIAQNITQQQAAKNAENLIAGAAVADEQMLQSETPAIPKGTTQASTPVRFAQATHVMVAAMQADQQMQQDNSAFSDGRGGLAKPQMAALIAAPENAVENSMVDVDTVIPAPIHNPNNPVQQRNSTSHEMQVTTDAIKVNPDQLLKQVADRLSDQGLKQGSNQITLKLSPDHLGNLQMSLTMADQQLRVEIIAENRAVRDVLMQKIDELKETLAQQNIKMESFDVSSGTNGGFSQQSTNWRQAASERRYQELRYSDASKATIPTMVTDAASVQYVAQQYQSTIDVRF